MIQITFSSDKLCSFNYPPTFYAWNRTGQSAGCLIDSLSVCVFVCSSWDKSLSKLVYILTQFLIFFLILIVFMLYHDAYFVFYFSVIKLQKKCKCKYYFYQFLKYYITHVETITAYIYRVYRYSEFYLFCNNLLLIKSL